MADRKCLLIGYAGDPTVRHFLRFARREEFDFIELFEYFRVGIVHIIPARKELTISCGGEQWDLNQYASIYQRLLYPARPKTKRVSRIEQARFRALDLALSTSEAAVVNTPYAGWENNFKPLQTHLLSAAGFSVPRSLSTSMQDDFLKFAARGSTIYKSNSGERSIVEKVRDECLGRASLLRSSPVFFQEQIVGKDVRVHCVGNRTFGVEILSDAVDYRYASRQGSESIMRPIHRIPEIISKLCVSYAAARGIFLAGFDFKVDGNGKWYCLEMNPNPGFDSYDRVLGGVIGSALVDALMGRS